MGCRCVLGVGVGAVIQSDKAPHLDAIFEIGMLGVNLVRPTRGIFLGEVFFRGPRTVLQCSCPETDIRSNEERLDSMRQVTRQVVVEYSPS